MSDHRQSSAIFAGHSFVAAPMLIDHVDTDQIIPSREMKQVSSSGLAEGLFAGWRYTGPDSRDEATDFVLNRPPFRTAQGLIAGVNFGCGSSREHAVWALREFGIRVIIAKSFGQIFHSNCAKNGILAISLPDSDVDALAQYMTAVTDVTEVTDVAAPSEPGARAGIAIDLSQCTLRFGGHARTFTIDPYDQRLLQEGLDPIGLTLTQSDQIEAFFRRDARARPWVG